MAPDLELGVGLEGRTVGPSGPGGYLQGYGSLVDFERLHSAAEEH